MTPSALSRRLLVAVFASVLLHAVLISGAWLHLPEKSFAPPPLEARLVTTPPPPVPAPPKVKPKPRPKPSARRAAPPRPPTPPVVAEAPLLALPPEPESESESPALVDEPEETAPPTPAPAPTAEAPPVPEPAPLKSLPRKGRITYTLYYGADKFDVGRTVQSWEVEGSGYKLASASETTGIVEFFRAQRLVYLSKGKLTAHGLQPETFFMSRTRRGRTEAAQARFDWEAGRITLGKIPNQRGAMLPAESQDLVSFMYQFAFIPPAPGRVRLPITTGSNFETYDLDVRSEEQIETPIGTLKALPVKQVHQPGKESIEIWFAVEYRYLPVKIRFFDREGNPAGEQIVNEIRISDE